MEEASALWMANKKKKNNQNKLGVKQQQQLKRQHDHKKQQQEPKQQPHAQSGRETKQNERTRYPRSHTPLGQKPGMSYSASTVGSHDENSNNEAERPSEGQ